MTQPINSSKKEKTKYEAIYITGLLEYLERTIRDVIKNDKDMSDYYMGQINTYQEIIKHIKKTWKQ